MKQYGTVQRFLPEPDQRQEAIYRQFFDMLPGELDKFPTLVGKMEVMLALGMIFRGVALCQQLTDRYGSAIIGGPFKGQRPFPEGIRPSGAMILTGMYEHQLHPAFERIIATPYDTIINIGCAEGLYAVGLALKMPNVRVIAADIDPEMQRRTRAMAEYNNVADRITIIGEVTHANLDNLVQGRTLVICDIEGGEETLLDAALVPALARCDMIVELHEVFKPGIFDIMQQRFGTTHTIERVEPYTGTPSLPDEFRYLTELERMLLTFEGRQGYTPWGLYWIK